TRRAKASSAPRSGATSGPASTIRSLPPSRSEIMRGSRQDRGSPRMSRPTLWPSLALGRRTRRGTPVESATTELARLPGLDVAVNTERPEAKPGHWIERGPLKRLMVFSGRSHPELAQRIAEQLGVELGEVELKTFANGETYCRYTESIRGADVFIVQ